MLDGQKGHMRQASGILILVLASMGLVTALYGLRLTQEYRREAVDETMDSSAQANTAATPIKFISINATDITDSAATINWIATKAGWATIEVGTDPNHLSPQTTPPTELSLVGAHQLTGLASGKRYYIRVGLLTPAGQQTTSEAYHFTTQ